MSGSWSLVEHAKQLAGERKLLPAGISDAVATRLLEAVTQGDPPETVGDLAASLASLVAALMAGAPEGFAKAVRDRDPDSHASLGVQLGQFVFAQQVAGLYSHRATAADFLAVLNEARWVPYLEALGQGQLTNGEIAERVGQRAETVSRKLQELRQLGVADFRKEGVSVRNFLTPAARSTLQSRRNAEPERASERDAQRVGEETAAIVKETVRALPEYWHQYSGFGPGRMRRSANG
jgi:DNA-binding transcriptional ArsR family regulator